MNISIAHKARDDSDPVMVLHLEYGENNSVYLIGTDANGEDWDIANINPSGISIRPSIGVTTGWPLDERGRLQQVDAAGMRNAL